MTSHTGGPVCIQSVNNHRQEIPCFVTRNHIFYSLVKNRASITFFFVRFRLFIYRCQVFQILQKIHILEALYLLVQRSAFSLQLSFIFGFVQFQYFIK
jgi:hypothetical protein